MKDPKHFLINFSQMFYSAEMLRISFLSESLLNSDWSDGSVCCDWSYAYSVSKLHYHIWISAYTIIH